MPEKPRMSRKEMEIKAQKAVEALADLYRGTPVFQELGVTEEEAKKELFDTIMEELEELCELTDE